MRELSNAEEGRSETRRFLIAPLALAHELVPRLESLSKSIVRIRAITLKNQILIKEFIGLDLVYIIPAT